MTGEVPERSIGNPGSTPNPADEMISEYSIGNPGSTPDPSDEVVDEYSMANPGATPDSDAPQAPASGDPGPEGLS